MRVCQLRMELRSVLPRRVPGNVTINFWACLAYIARKGFTSELCSEAANHSTHCNAVKLLKCFEDNHWWSFWHDFVISQYCGFFSLFYFVTCFENLLWVYVCHSAKQIIKGIWSFVSWVPEMVSAGQRGGALLRSKPESSLAWLRL